MKIYYIANARIPTEKAHGWQICRMCAELARQGALVELVVPSRNTGGQDAFEYYGLDKNFLINYLKTPDVLKLEKFDKILPVKAIYLLALFFLFKLVFFKAGKDAVIYTRNPEIAWLFGLKGRKVFYDAHSWPGSKTGIFKFLLRRARGVVCNSQGTAEEFKKNGFANILTAPNAVDLEKFAVAMDKQELRKKLDLPEDKKIIMYVGHLYEWKGADVIMEAAERLKDISEYLFVLVGGTDKDIAKYKNIARTKNLHNVVFAGHKPPGQMPAYMRSADLLLLPNVPATPESERYTSPIKLFEYMASRRLVLASDLPSLKEILNENNSVLFRAGDAEDFAAKIDEILKNPDKYRDLIEQAFRDVQEHTWEKRAKKVLSFISLAER